MSTLSEHLKHPPRKNVSAQFDNDPDATKEIRSITKSLIVSAVLENADPTEVIEAAIIIGFELGNTWHEIEQLETQFERDLANNIPADLVGKDKLLILQNMAMLLANLQENTAVVDSANELFENWSNSELMGLFRLSRKLIKARSIAGSDN